MRNKFKMFKLAYHFARIEILIYNKQNVTHFQLKVKIIFERIKGV